MNFLRPALVSLLLLGGVLSHADAAEPAFAPAAWFVANPRWSTAESVTLASDGSRFETTPGAAILYSSAARSPQLRTHSYLGDCVVRLEFMLTAKAQAGLYVQGRYRIQLATEAMGALAPMAEPTAADAHPLGEPARVAAPAQPGKWQVCEIKFRAARFDDARNKTEDALLIEAKIDGKIVQANAVVTGWSRGSEFTWHDSGGHTTIAVDSGGLAIRDFSIRSADFGAVQVPKQSGQPGNVATLVDFVKRGEEIFRSVGCVECHAVQRDDASVKTGPNLFGLFTLEPRDRTIAAGGEGHRFTIKADRAYFQRSIRTPADELAIAESGPTQGQPYLPAMPPYTPAVLSDPQLEAIASYLGTLNDVWKQGPVIRLVKETGPKNYDPMTDRLQLLVDKIVRIQRGPLENVSGRAIHVGQPDGINFSFDPRVLAVVKIWQGGFLDLSGELMNRGGRGFKTGFDSREIDLGAAGALLAPLNAQGNPIDFSFKEAKFRDGETVRQALNDPRDPLDRLAAVDAQFLGYERDSKNPLASPIFHYRVGRNVVSLGTEFSATGEVRIIVAGKFDSPQSFTVNESALGRVEVSAGELKDGRWILPAGTHAGVVAKGRLTLAPKVWRPASTSFDYTRQPLVIEPSQPNLPAGYRAETYLGPKDTHGRDMLFEALGLAAAPDGTIVVSTRTAGIWRLVKNEWRLFAEGTFDSLGVQIEDEHGLRVVIGQKAEVTRLEDTNGDGLADKFETLADAFSYHGNYHSYIHGPVRDANGDYFITLNLDDAGQVDYEYRAGGKYMGTGGGFRGWAARVKPGGGFEPWASGLRSPAGLGVAPDGRLWYADNQGEYMGTSKLFVVKKDAFYGHPAGLVDRPGMTPASPEIAWKNVMNQRERAVVLFPQNRLANSPGNPAWDTTRGHFGPFAGQMFIGDQTQSNLLRVATERVGDHEQGVAIPFATDLESGVMRPVFLADGSVLLGQTGRGWQAKGGRVASLQRIMWDGKTVPPAIHHVSAIAGGFELSFTLPIAATLTEKELAPALAIKSWVYRDAPDYGSPEMDERAEAVTRVEIGADRTMLRVTLKRTDQPKVHPQQTARVYQLTVDGKVLWTKGGSALEAFYTLYQFPSSKR
ncbi:MAG TPA: family 16 glycoside hydrolase [Opitutaceae bacterium]|nr:family 16 glycoside hydrolase [Opitutaceae bacterium]